MKKPREGGYVQCRVFKDYDFAIMVHTLMGRKHGQIPQFLALDCFRARAITVNQPMQPVSLGMVSTREEWVQPAIHAMDMMRQQVRPESRIGTWIIAGGTASNVIPEFGELEVTVRHN